MNDILNQYRENPALISEDSIKDLQKPFDESKTIFYSTRDAYNADLETRRNNLAGQAEKIDKKIKSLTIERNKLAAAVNDAVSRTDIELAAELETRLDELDAEITICNRKVKLASASDLKGDPILYKEVQDTYQIVTTIYDGYRSSLIEIASICEEQIKRYENLFTKAKQAAEYSGYHYEYSAFEQIKDHFTEGPKLRAAAEAAAIAENKASEESGKRTRHIFAG